MRTITTACVLALCLAALRSTTAAAEDPACLGAYSFRASQHTQGTLETRPGKPCRSIIWVSGITTVKSIQVVQKPKNGTVSVVGTSAYRFAPRAGFTGQDSMTLRVNMTGSQNKPSSGTVTLQISVR